MISLFFLALHHQYTDQYDSSFREINRKLPKVACEAEKELYFSIEVGGPKTLKEAKHAWQELFNCTKKVEAELNRAATLKRPQL